MRRERPARRRTQRAVGEPGGVGRRSRIDHIGLAVHSIEEFLRQHAALYAGFRRGPVIVNKRQRVREVFITDGRTVLELLEPLSEQSPIAGFLKKNEGGGLLHVALEVDELEPAIAQVRAVGGFLVTGPVPDVAFQGRRIAFVAVGDQVTELVERRRPRAGGEHPMGEAR